MSETYPRDDFDDLPEGAPVGVHRKPRNPWAPVIPFLVVLLVVPLLAWGVATLIQRNVPEEEIVEVLGQSEEVVQSDGQSEVIQEETEVVIPDSDLPTAAPDDPNAEGTPETAPEETPVVQYETSVAVLNATGIAGHAAATAEQIVAAGFPNTWAGNAEQWFADVNTVFYPNASMRATADAVAAAAGITTVVEDAAVVGDSGIVVVLAQ